MFNKEQVPWQLSTNNKHNFSMMKPWTSSETDYSCNYNLVCDNTKKTVMTQYEMQQQ